MAFSRWLFLQKVLSHIWLGSDHAPESSMKDCWTYKTLGEDVACSIIVFIKKISVFVGAYLYWRYDNSINFSKYRAENIKKIWFVFVTIVWKLLWSCCNKLKFEGGGTQIRVSRRISIYWKLRRKSNFWRYIDPLLFSITPVVSLNLHVME